MFDVEDAKPYHAGMIARRMRDSHRDALLALGFNRQAAHRSLSCSLADSVIARAAFHDGSLMAIGGVCGTLASREGFLWIVACEDVGEHKLAFVRAAKAELLVCANRFSVLRTGIIAADIRSVAFARAMGFLVDMSSGPVLNAVLA